ncbi:hypothetical protein IW262DRAFT_1395818 [Armillaria fumosa]|nr:hypothetical protein IW262DRAFT_1395818 [Armillaria fumosa]
MSSPHDEVVSIYDIDRRYASGSHPLSAESPPLPLSPSRQELSPPSSHLSTLPPPSQPPPSPQANLPSSPQNTLIRGHRPLASHLGRQSPSQATLQSSPSCIFLRDLAVRWSATVYMVWILLLSLGALSVFPITIIHGLPLVGNQRIVISCLGTTSIFVSLLNLYLVVPRRTIALLTLVFGMEGPTLKILFWNLVTFIVVPTIFAVADFSRQYSAVVLCCGSCGRYHLFVFFTLYEVCHMFDVLVIMALLENNGNCGE